MTLIRQSPESSDPAKSGDMFPENVTFLCLASDDPGVRCPSTSALLVLPCDFGETPRTQLVGSDDIILRVTQFLCMDALLSDNSGISEPLFVNMPDLVIYVIIWTGMVHMYHPRGVCLFASIGFLLESACVHYVLTVLWDNGRYDTLIDHRTTLDLRIDEGVEVMTFVGDTPGVFPQPWLPGLSSWVRFMVITGLHLHAIVWCLFRAIYLVRFCTQAVVSRLLKVARSL